MSNDYIAFENVTFFGDVSKTPILSDMSLVIPQDKVTCLLGASGSGKSTILRLISGLLTPHSGTIKLRGQVVSHDNHILLKAEKRKIAFMFQDYALMPFMTVLDNVLFAVKKIKNKLEEKQKALQILDDLELLDYAKKYPTQLSGGEQQRLALARAIMQNTDIVMLDEPFSNLDSELRRRLREETLSVLQKHQKTVLMVTHDPAEAFLSSDHIIYLRDGQIVQSGTPEHIYLQPKNLDVALFSGAVNILSGVVKGRYAQTQIGYLPVTTNIEGHVTVAIRHEGFILKPQDTALMNAKILKKEFAGKFYRLTLTYNNYIFVAELMDYSVNFLNIGDYIALSLRDDAIFVFS
ncbi:MAG: iron(III) transport system ATP-binding protein [Alphaproteobacteria bacterium]|jgi:iron(III) transport system ATP-binding protein